MMDCITLLVMIRTNSLHYRKRITVLLKCTVLMTILITYLVSSYHIHTHDITVEHVTYAIIHLKSENNDNFEGLTSDNFRNDSHLLNVYISLLFSTMLSQGTAPAILLLSTMVILIKKKRDFCNYRAIAISSLLGKLFDTILLKLQHAI